MAWPCPTPRRSVTCLTGFARVDLAPCEQRGVIFRLHTDRLAYVGPDMSRIIEPGEITVMIGVSGTDIHLTGAVHLTGPLRRVGHEQVLHTPGRTG